MDSGERLPLVCGGSYISVGHCTFLLRKNQKIVYICNIHERTD
jgi:hypothetical protein